MVCQDDINVYDLNVKTAFGKDFELKQSETKLKVIKCKIDITNTSP